MKKAHEEPAIRPRVNFGALQMPRGVLVRDKGDPDRVPDSQQARQEGARGKKTVCGKPK